MATRPIAITREELKSLNTAPLALRALVSTIRGNRAAGQGAGGRHPQRHALAIEAEDDFRKGTVSGTAECPAGANGLRTLPHVAPRHAQPTRWPRMPQGRSSALQGNADRSSLNLFHEPDRSGRRQGKLARGRQLVPPRGRSVSFRNATGSQTRSIHAGSGYPCPPIALTPMAIANDNYLSKATNVLIASEDPRALARPNHCRQRISTYQSTDFSGIERTIAGQTPQLYIFRY